MAPAALSAIESFCRERFGPACGIEKLAGDASTRIYYRISAGGSTKVLMDTGSSFLPESDPFILCDELFALIGLPVPRVLDIDGTAGFVVLEDMGDLLLQRRLAGCPEPQRDALYDRALEHLLVLHTRGTLELLHRPGHPAASQALDRDRFLFELEFMREHYLQGLIGARLTGEEDAALSELFERLAGEVSSFGRVLCHRDYHSRNLMVHGSELAILDFQDARWGPVTYDIASLLYDSYVSLPEPFVGRTVEAFRLRLLARLDEAAGTQADRGDSERLRGLRRDLGATLGDPDEFRRRFDLTCLQRNLKALGTFGFQTTVRGNDVYRQYVAPTTGHVRRNFGRFPEFARAFEILDRALEW